MSEYTHVLLIVPAALAHQYRQMASALPSGAGMGLSAFSATGEAPATHYIDHGQIWSSFAAMLEIDTPPAERTGQYLAAQFGVPVADAKAMLDVCDISRDYGIEFIHARGLFACTRINVNDASKTALESAPGIGSVKAQQIIDGRPWASVAELAGLGLDVAVLDHWYTV